MTEQLLGLVAIGVMVAVAVAVIRATVTARKEDAAAVEWQRIISTYEPVRSAAGRAR